ncbi:MAG TPA: hypothetical protein VJ881_08500 [Halanaerobiales bacterium]|nr:hypothetical protein [Halanaerobiales bacterium]
MFDKKNNLHIKILGIIFIVLLFFYINRQLNVKINSYENLILKKQNEIKVENKYKQKYIHLEEKYDFKIFKKDEIIENLNLIIDKNNIKLVNMKTREKEDKFLVSLKISVKFDNLNLFLDNISQEKNFYNLKTIMIQKDMNYEDNLLVEIEILFNLSVFIDNNSNNFLSKKIYSNLKNPYKSKISNSDYVLNYNNKEIEISLPMRLTGIIIGKKNKLAIIEINNEIKSIKEGFKKFGVEVMDINIDNIIVKYKDLFLKINLGGNKGVLQ